MARAGAGTERRFPTIPVKITIAKYYTPTGRCIQVLDYSHRRDDGTVGSVPDSLKKEFKTDAWPHGLRHRRIDPDYKVEPMLPPPLTRVIYSNGFILIMRQCMPSGITPSERPNV